MSVHDAQLSDIYVDKQGKLWRCIMTCHEPTVTFEEVEGHTVGRNSNMLAGAAAQANIYGSEAAPPIIKAQQRGGVSGFMWDGWKRIWRKEEAA